MLRYPIIDIIGFYLYRSGIDNDHDYNIMVSIMLQSVLIWRHTSHAVLLGCLQLSLLSVGIIIQPQVCRLMGREIFVCNYFMYINDNVNFNNTKRF